MTCCGTDRKLAHLPATDLTVDEEPTKHQQDRHEARREKMFTEHTTFYGRRNESGKRGFETVKAIFSRCHGDPTTQHELAKQEPAPGHNQPLPRYVCIKRTKMSRSTPEADQD